MNNQNKTPKKQELIQKVLDIIEDEEATEETVLSGLRLLKKYDKSLCETKALEMLQRNERVISVCDILLSLIPPEKKKGLGIFDGDSFKLTKNQLPTASKADLPLPKKGDIK